MKRAEIERRLDKLAVELDNAETERNMWEQIMYRLQREKTELESMLDETQ